MLRRYRKCLRRYLGGSGGDRGGGTQRDLTRIQTQETPANSRALCYNSTQSPRDKNLRRNRNVKGEEGGREKTRRTLGQDAVSLVVVRERSGSRLVGELISPKSRRACGEGAANLAQPQRRMASSASCLLAPCRAK